jgi:hypothetical protein
MNKLLELGFLIVGAIFMAKGDWQVASTYLILATYYSIQEKLDPNKDTTESK